MQKLTSMFVSYAICLSHVHAFVSPAGQDVGRYIDGGGVCSGVDDGHAYIRQLTDSLVDGLSPCRCEYTNRMYHS
jgi:hypothetical protein